MPHKTWEEYKETEWGNKKEDGEGERETSGQLSGGRGWKKKKKKKK